MLVCRHWQVRRVARAVPMPAVPAVLVHIGGAFRHGVVHFAHKGGWPANVGLARMRTSGRMAGRCPCTSHQGSVALDCARLEHFSLTSIHSNTRAHCCPPDAHGVLHIRFAGMPLAQPQRRPRPGAAGLLSGPHHRGLHTGGERRHRTHWERHACSDTATSRLQRTTPTHPANPYMSSCCLTQSVRT